MFWKKVNRGLILGAALLIFLIGFIVVKEVSFEKETPLIKENVESYLSDLFKLQCNVDGELEKELSTESKEAQKTKFNQLLKDYWYGNLPTDEYNGYGVSETRQYYDEYLEGIVTVLFSSAEVRFSESETSVRKDGPDRAIVTISADVRTTYRGDGSQLFYGSNVYQGYYYGYDAQTYTGILHLEGMRFEMQRVNREWKIVGFIPGYAYESERVEKGE